MLDPKIYHSDWPFPFCYVKRSLTRYPGNPPVMIFGNSELTKGVNGVLYPKPIPKPGQWFIASPLYFAMTTKTGWHFRIGDRWDDNANEYEFPSFTIKKIS